MDNTDKHKYEPTELPEAGKKKANPKELDKELDTALEDSMDASDPPAVTMPEVKKKDDKRPH
jgi:hypothetical protein